MSPHPPLPANARTSAGSAAGRGPHASARAKSVSPPQDEARRQAARERLIVLTRLLDTAFYVPVLRTRAGLDAVLGLIPGVGDLITAALGLYQVYEARELGASRWLRARMIGNLLLDFAAGAVPLVGDLFDVYFKAHVRNLKLLQKELGEPYIDGSSGRVRSEDAGGDVIDVEPVSMRDTPPAR
jgi:hypothetical protein